MGEREARGELHCHNPHRYIKKKHKISAQIFWHIDDHHELNTVIFKRTVCKKKKNIIKTSSCSWWHWTRSSVISEELVTLILFRFLIRNHNYIRQKWDFFTSLLLICLLSFYSCISKEFSKPKKYNLRFSVHIPKITFRLISVLVLGFPVPVLICGNTISLFFSSNCKNWFPLMHAARSLQSSLGI